MQGTKGLSHIGAAQPEASAALKVERAQHKVQLGGRDELTLTLELEGGVIRSAKLVAVGCPRLLQLAQEWRPRFKGPVSELPVPEGANHAEILLRELCLRAKGEWMFPYTDEELCHCRAVPTAKVDQAIIAGAHSVAQVSRLTSAGTACGTCRPDTERILAYRLGRR